MLKPYQTIGRALALFKAAGLAVPAYGEEEKRRLFAAFDRATDLAVFLVHKREDVLRLKEIWQKAREQQRKADAPQRAAG